ncbi:MetQ/NlpA family ABC transporter substrate-binding protein [Microbacterium sp. zg.Y1090]|uniref:MetQ/NlpA family ABC transporter substrate-binding protein n=1 Tax=Microbacterium TaxID=33882 RepID=UPI00214AAC42|nr:MULTISPECIES: MetQ/NlpA family ABC transporter substrate-binding protein [unclassified Microbacterium]MCR2813069.1 MetQ/NlpA family ABC transporter substrate-binding protein [Microbacterium sp. zg.Y1084]MCR2819383.1 MetQ/NlpA family ABC transporter substrate-binding protein [Microbacterium sp. zg.Y1090]MDL5487300.1 MetQ/NlpA family ABC transporter substrate-binding protein [Microbacterium sp. zg-Y1211]WIM28363.1 MetQ/NlpA family ABC transporter substrate-binding protein [Microbacterium sp. z
MSRTPRIPLLAAVAAAALVLTACAGGTSADSDTAASDGLGTIKVGALQTPAGDILQHIAENGAAEVGLTIEFVPFTDYNTPNTALADGSIDANLFQNSTFLETFNEATGSDLVSVGQAYLPSAAFYSDKVDSLDELEDGATIAIPNDPTNEGRALKLLADEGLIEVTDDVVDLSGITANPRDFRFTEIENATLPQALPDVDAAFVTISFALPAGLTGDQAILLEGESSPYYNVLATRPDLVDDPRIEALYELLTSQETADFEVEQWGGLVVPVVG